MTADAAAHERAPRPARVIDAHMHLWDLSQRKNPWLCDTPLESFRYGDYASIRRDYRADDYRRDAAGWNVVATVYVEAEWDPEDPIGETRWISEVSAREGFPNAVVAQAWIDADDAHEVIAAQAEFPLVRSVRHKPKSAARPSEASRGARGSLDDPRWRRGFEALGRHGLHFDLQTPWWHLDAAAELAADAPDTLIILNHTGLPADRSEEGLAAWRSALETFAAAPNARLKISGIGVAGRRWSAEENRPVIRDALAIFGVERCMFASNYPVDSLVGEMRVIFDGFDAATQEFAPEMRAALFHDNARRVYRIDAADSSTIQ